MNQTYKFWHLAVVTAVALMAAGCSGEQDRRLDAMVDETNAACPIAIGSDIAVEKVSRSGDVLIYDVKVDLPVRQLAENAAVARRLVADAIAGSEEPEVKAELETCRDAGATMKYVLTDALGDTFSIVVNPADYLR